MGAELIQGQHLADELLTLLPAKLIAAEIVISDTAKVTAPIKVIAALCAAMQKQEPLLWKGDWQASGHGILGYPSHSEADMALCGAITRQAVNIGILIVKNSFPGYIAVGF